MEQLSWHSQVPLSKKELERGELGCSNPVCATQESWSRASGEATANGGERSLGQPLCRRWQQDLSLNLMFCRKNCNCRSFLFPVILCFLVWAAFNHASSFTMLSRAASRWLLLFPAASKNICKMICGVAATVLSAFPVLMLRKHFKTAELLFYNYKAELCLSRWGNCSINKMLMEQKV